MSWTRDEVAARAARELSDGDYVNLGIGIPTLVANHIPSGLQIVFQSENGLLGMGPYPLAEEVDHDLVNAGKQTVTALPGASYFASSDSFAMIRGGHIAVAILGAMEVAANGDLANWAVPGTLVKGMGGAMDLVAGARRVIVVTDHQDKHGRAKLRTRCSLPLTGAAVVDLVITDLGVFACRDDAFVLREAAPGVDLPTIRMRTDAEVHDGRSEQEPIAACNGMTGSRTLAR